MLKIVCIEKIKISLSISSTNKYTTLRIIAIDVFSLSIASDSYKYYSPIQFSRLVALPLVCSGISRLEVPEQALDGIPLAIKLNIHALTVNMLPALTWICRCVNQLRGIT